MYSGNWETHFLKCTLLYFQIKKITFFTARGTNFLPLLDFSAKIFFFTCSLAFSGEQDLWGLWKMTKIEDVQ